MKQLGIFVIALVFAFLVVWAQEPTKKPATIEELQAQVDQLEHTVAQKDQQIASMSAQLIASGKMFSVCFQNLGDAEQRAAAKK